MEMCYCVQLDRLVKEFIVPLEKQIRSGEQEEKQVVENETREIITLSSFLASLKKFLEEEFECAICLESCTDTLVNPECNHRFCGKCIKESLQKCNHECPTCRVHIPTYRTCRRDPQFDHIVSSRTKTK
jgi:hypothetical protein